MNDWSTCKNILCIRPDNMGDIIMTGPALRALKQTFNCRITLLTSKMGSLVTPHIPEIDETITCTLPWVKSTLPANAETTQELVGQLRERNFDAAIIFTVYSQNPLPSVMLAFMAGIPLRLAYCRENPYELITDWIPDEEPYKFIQHQVERDLLLVKHIGAKTNNEQLQIQYQLSAVISMQEKLKSIGHHADRPILVLHPGVSEKKREVPISLWISLIEELSTKKNTTIVITGAESEKSLANSIQQKINAKILNATGLLSIEEFIALVAAAELVVSVNTATVHIAASTQTPVVVLYALTNPQHYPWKAPCKVLSFTVQEELRSRNQVIDYVSNNVMNKEKPLPTVEDIISSIDSLLNNTDN